MLHRGGRGVRGAISSAFRSLLPPTVEDYGSTSPPLVLFDFTKPTEALKARWDVLQDASMSGSSTGEITWVENNDAPDEPSAFMRFRGHLRSKMASGVENKVKPFCAARTLPFDDPVLVETIQHDRIEIVARGDGRRYSFNIVPIADTAWDTYRG